MWMIDDLRCEELLIFFAPESISPLAKNNVLRKGIMGRDF